MRRLDNSRHGWLRPIPGEMFDNFDSRHGRCREGFYHRPPGRCGVKKKEWTEMLEASDPGICMEPKTSYSFRFKDPEEVVPQEACHFESGSNWQHNQEENCLIWTRVVSSQGPQDTAAHQPPGHRSISTPRLPHRAIAVLEGKNQATQMPSCHNTGVILPLSLVLRTRRPEEKCSKVFKVAMAARGYTKDGLHRHYPHPRAGTAAAWTLQTFLMQPTLDSLGSVSLASAS